MHRFTLYNDLKKETQQMINSSPIVKLKKNDYLFRIREEVTSIYILISGYLLIQRESEHHGIRSIFILNDELINEVILDNKSASVNALALTDIEVIKINREEYIECMNNDSIFNTYTYTSMAKKIRRLYHQVETSTKVTLLSHQVASKLWKFGRDYGIEKGEYIEIPFEIRITLLASFVGSNRETVSRILKRMMQEKIISIDKGICKIYDMNLLKNYQ